MQPGQTVSVSVSNGPPQIPIPDVQGQSCQDAQQALAQAGFTNVNVQQGWFQKNKAIEHGPVRAGASRHADQPAVRLGRHLVPLIGSHATVTGGVATGGLAYAAAVGAEVIQVFVSNPRGWAAAPGDPVRTRGCARRASRSSSTRPT